MNVAQNEQTGVEPGGGGQIMQWYRGGAGVDGTWNSTLNINAMFSTH